MDSSGDHRGAGIRRDMVHARLRILADCEPARAAGVARLCRSAVDAPRVGLASRPAAADASITSACRSVPAARRPAADRNVAGPSN